MGFLQPAIDWLETQNWGPFDFVRVGILTLLNILDPIVTAFVNRAEAFINKLWELDLRIFSFITDTLDKLRVGFNIIWDEIVYLVLYAADRIRELVEVWFDKIKEAIETIIPNLVENVNDLIDKLADLGEGILSDVQNFLDTVWPTFTEFVNASIQFLTDFVKFLRDGLEWLESKVTEVANEFDSFLQTSWQIFTTNTTNLLNVLNQTVFNVIIPSLQSAWDILTRIPSAILDLLNQPEKIREEEPGIRESTLTHMQELLKGKTPTEIQPPQKLSTTLHSSPIGILELLFFFLIQVFGFNLFGLYRWFTEFPGAQRDKDTLPDVREMSLEELMNSVDHLLGSIEDLIAGIAERIIVVHPDGTTGTITDVEMADPDVVAEYPFGLPGLTYILYTVKPHGFYIVLNPFVGGYKCTYDEEKDTWKVEWASAEECRRLMDKAGFKIISFGGS